MSNRSILMGPARERELKSRREPTVGAPGKNQYSPQPADYPADHLAYDPANSDLMSVEVAVIEEADGATHLHEMVELLYAHSGEHSCRAAGRDLCLKPGRLVVIPPGVLHKITTAATKPSKLYLCRFHPDAVTSLILSPQERSSLPEEWLSPPAVSAALDEAMVVTIEELLSRMARECHDRSIGYETMTRAGLLELLVAIGRIQRTKRAAPDSNHVDKSHLDAMRNTIGYIERHYHEPLSLNDVCAHAMMCQSYFSRYFKLLTKTTFVDYVNRLKIRRAKELLRSTRDRVVDISSAVGFRDISHFNRVFRKHTNLTPTRYRKLMQSRYAGAKKRNIERNIDR